MFNRSSNLKSSFSFNAVTGQPTATSFNSVSNVSTRYIFPRAGSSGWSGDFITSDYYGIDELGLGAAFGTGIFEGIRHFNL